jgi:hypothetical protein
MSRKHLASLLIALSAAALWAACANTGFAFLHGHRARKIGNSPTYPNATPHGGFSSSNGYYSGRSRIADAPPPPAPARRPQPDSPSEDESGAQ